MSSIGVEYSNTLSNARVLPHKAIPISSVDSVPRDLLRRALPNKVLLRNSSKKIWSVGITETRDDIFFQDGWEKFVEDNSIKQGYGLVFEYDGHGMFDFLLFDKSHCEKVAKSDTRICAKESNAVPVDSGNCTMILAIKKEEEIDETIKDGQSVGGDDYDDDEYNDDDEDDGGEEDDHMPDHTHSAGGGRRGLQAGEGSSSKRPRDVPDHYGARIFKSGHYTQPTNPYFLARIRSTRRNELYIPMDIMKGFEFPPSLILRDPKGKEWEVKTKVWCDGRRWVTGGWRSLCRWNLVEKDDRLVCEILLPEKGRGKMVLHVSTIIREASKYT